MVTSYNIILKNQAGEELCFEKGFRELEDLADWVNRKCLSEDLVIVDIQVVY